VGVFDQLRLGGGARGEVEQERVAGPGHRIRRENRRSGIGVYIGQPAVDRRTDRDPGVIALDAIEDRRDRGGDDDVLGPAAVEPVPHVGRAEQRRRRDDHRTQLHRGEDRLPQLDLVAEHEDQPVAAGHSLGAQPVGHLVGAAGQLRKRPPLLAAVRLDDPQRRPVVLGADPVEPVQGPVELVELGPAEVAIGRVVVVCVGQKERPRLCKGGHAGNLLS
jgi:hypothetical protein